MKTYARIHDGLVAELLKTDGDITRMFHPTLIWVDVSSQASIAEGWHFDGTDFAPPTAPPATAPALTIAELEALFAIISAQLETLSAKVKHDIPIRTRA